MTINPLKIIEAAEREMAARAVAPSTYEEAPESAFRLYTLGLRLEELTPSITVHYLSRIALAAKALSAKLEAIKPYVDSMTTLQFARTGVQYSGPNYAGELTELNKLLEEIQ